MSTSGTPPRSLDEHYEAAAREWEAWLATRPRPLAALIRLAHRMLVRLAR
jgi:hypothetical protein